MHEIVYLKERNVKPKEFDSSTDGDQIWYLDNGASNHMTGNRNYYKVNDNTVSVKVTMDIEEAKCMQLRSQSDHSSWHARLCHLRVDAMKTMIEKELVSGITKQKVQKEICDPVCVQSKQDSHFRLL